MGHGDNVSFVLTGTWHVKILGSSVELHTEGELSLLLTWGVDIIRVARIREVEVSLNIVLGAWNTHILNLIALLLLDGSDFSSALGAIVNGRTLSTLVGHAKWRRLFSVSHMNWIVGARA